MATDSTIAGAQIGTTRAETLTMSAGEVLRIPAMRRLWIAQLVSTFGDFLALFSVISFFTFRLGATPDQVIGLQLAYLLPIAALGPVAGVFVDIWPPKVTLVASDLTRAILCLLLIPSSTRGQFYAVLASISFVSAFFSPAQGVAIRRVVPFGGLRSAQALMQQVLFGMRVVGPPLAILVFKAFGAKISYIADAVSFLASAGLIASATLNPRPVLSLGEPSPAAKAVAADESQRIWASYLFAGFQSIFKNRPVLFASGAMAISMLVIGGFGSLLSVYIRDVLKASSGTYSLATLTTGLGLFIGANLSGLAIRRISDARQIVLSLGTIAFGLLLLAFFPHIWSVFLADLLIGISVGTTAVVKDTIIQQQTPPALLGRTSSTMLSVIFSSQIFGMIFSGALAEYVGVRVVLGLIATIPVAFGLLAMFRMARR